MITVLSYMQGLSGDFIAYQIHQNPTYESIELAPNSQNRYVMPCLTEPVFGWEIKNTRNQIDQQRLKVLQTVYKRNIILPTHQFRPVYNDNLTWIRLHSQDESIVKLSYAMWIFKSHVILQPPWLDRYDQICATPEPIRTELLTKYHKWKYMSYQHKLMPNGQFDLRHYIKNYYTIYSEKVNINTNARQGYTYFDIAELLYQCKPDSLEQHLNITLDRQAISEYTDNNFKQLNNRGLQLDDLNFLDNLTDVVEQQMLQTIDLNDYINENSNNPDIRSRFAST